MPNTSIAPDRKYVRRAAQTRMPAHGYAPSRVNFQAGKVPTPAARRVGPVLKGNGGIFHAASNAGKAVARNIPAGIGRVKIPQIKLPNFTLPFDPGSLIRADAKAIDSAVERAEGVTCRHLIQGSRR